MAQTNHIERVAIVGATGNIGKAFAEQLVKTGKHTVTAITREESKGAVPDGVKVARYKSDDDGNSLVAALQGQQFLIITLSVRAAPEAHSNIVQAAAKAGVPYIMPNIYGADVQNRALFTDSLVGETYQKNLGDIETRGLSYVVLVCGFWYEWSLALGEALYGFDIQNKKAVLFDDGKTVINTSTWDQCGRALASFLSLPVSGASPAISDWKNKPLYISSFRASQRDMLDSLNRVLGTTDKDWEITYDPTAERRARGIEQMQQGDRMGFARALYARGFYPNGDGDFESSRGLANDALGLPKEDFDEVTKRAVELARSDWNPFG